MNETQEKAEEWRTNKNHKSTKQHGAASELLRRLIETWHQFNFTDNKT